MRWLVSVTSLGKTESESLQIEADTWQGALQLARAERGDGASLGSLSIELSEAGCRAIDATSLLSYRVRSLADDEIVPGATTPSRPPEPGGRTASSLPPRPSGSGWKRPSTNPPPPQPTRRSDPPPAAWAAPAAPAAPAQLSHAPAPAHATDVVILKPQVIDAAPASVPSTAPPPSSKPRAVDSSGIPLQVVFKREEERTDAKPLTYREYVYVVPPQTSEQDVHTLLYHQLELVRASLERLPPGKLVNLAAFDAQFQGKPQGAPLATLTWKDWRPEAIVYTPRHASSANGVTAPATAASPAVQSPRNASNAGFPAQSPAIVRPATPSAPPPSAPPPSAPPVAEPAPPVAEPAPPVAEPAVAERPAPREAPRTEKSPERPLTPVPDPFAQPAQAALSEPPAAAQPAPAPQPAFGSMAPAPDTKHSVQRRVAGDELVADLFEVMHDLHFLRDALEGGEFCLAVAMEKLPSEAGWVHLYDIDRREFVITSVRGAQAVPLVLRRHSEREKLLADAMRGRRPVVIENAAEASDLAGAERFNVVGGARSVIAAPVMQAGRFLGAIELVNPLDGLPFTTTDGDAMAYIADQFAEFVASRGVVTDEERIAARKPKA